MPVPIPRELARPGVGARRLRTLFAAHGGMVLLCAAAGIGCAPGVGKPPSASAQGAVSEQKLARLRELSEGQAQHITELEARVSLLEAEARRARAAAAGKMSDTVTIGGSEAAPRAPRAELERLDDDLVDDRPPIALRLHGRPVRGEAVRGPLEPVPTVSERLPVAPLPGQPALASAGAGQAPGAGPVAEGTTPRAAYRRALALLKQRHFQQAAEAFERFVHGHPTHRLVPSAVYWRAEAQYARRAYADALLGFTQVIERYPQNEKAPKALYKLGLCHQRLGDRAAAERCFARLRMQFPDSELAKRASVEGSS